MRKGGVEWLLKQAVIDNLSLVFPTGGKPKVKQSQGWAVALAAGS